MPGTYKDVKDSTIVAQFKVQMDEKANGLFGAFSNEDIYLLAWTTTPWTLPSNTALSVGKNIEYALVKSFNPYTYLPLYVVLEKDLIGKYFSEKSENSLLPE
jgi:isoleucyl-tRNA synthetase